MSDPPPPVVTDWPFDSPEARLLVGRLDAELAERYALENIYADVDPDDLGPGRGAFVIARLGDEPVGCGAVRRLPDGRGEIKRMYVAPQARRRGIAAAVLAALEEHSARLGIADLVLETGDAQPEALGLYARAGYSRIPCWGDYQDDPTSVCFGKQLTPGGTP